MAPVVAAVRREARIRLRVLLQVRARLLLVLLPVAAFPALRRLLSAVLLLRAELLLVPEVLAGEGLLLHRSF